MATHSSALAWRILWTEEPGGLPSMGSQSRARLKPLSSSSSSVFMSVLLSPFVQSLPPPLCPQVHSLHLSLHSFPASRFISAISLVSIHVC